MLSYKTRERIRGFWSRWIGWRLACWLDKKHPDWCWTWIATDIGMGEPAWDDPWRMRSNADCKTDCERLGSCWCGKLRKEEALEA
jgi:hypothetical protein